jgi:hypothetical protein
MALDLAALSIVILALLFGWLCWRKSLRISKGGLIDDVPNLQLALGAMTNERDRTALAFFELRLNTKAQVEEIRTQRDTATRQLGSVLYLTRAPSTQALVDGYNAWKRSQKVLEEGPCWFSSLYLRGREGQERCQRERCQRCAGLRGEDAGGQEG